MADKLIIVYFIIINIIAFGIYGMDKLKAKQNAWRISEKMLFGVAFLGGSVGAYAGMKVFHHKTRHWYFVVGIPLIFMVQAILALYVGGVFS